MLMLSVPPAMIQSAIPARILAVEPASCPSLTRDGITDDDVVDAMRVELRHGSQQALDDGDRQIIGTVEAKFTAFGFSDSRSVTGHNICFLHSIIF